MRKMVFLMIFTLLMVPSVFSQSEDDFDVGLTDDGKGVVIKKYIGTVLQVRIPATIQGIPVKEIGDNSFQEFETAFKKHMGITSVEIPNGVIIIKRFAFYGCEKLSHVIIPESVTIIEDSAFGICTSLRSITLPSGLKQLGGGGVYGPFFHSGLTSITIPADITVIRDGTFYKCENLERIVLPEGLITIGEDAFNCCTKLIIVNLPSTI